MAQRFLDEKTAGIEVAELSMPFNEWLKPTWLHVGFSDRGCGLARTLSRPKWHGVNIQHGTSSRNFGGYLFPPA